MFKEKVNTRTDGRTTDNGPWHKLAGLQPVELKMRILLVGGVEIIVGKGENASYQHFSFPHNVFNSPLFQVC